MEKPNYYGLLPANVRYDKRLKPMEKILYSEITALANVHGYCYAGNSYFGKLYEVHKNTVGVWINNLVECGYLKVKMIYKEGSKEVLERRLYIVDLKEVPLSAPVEEEKVLEKEREEKHPINEKIDTPINKNIGTLSTKSLIPYQQKNGYPINEIIEGNTTRVNIINENITSNNTTTKLDKVNKIEKEEASTKSSSSFVLEKSLEDSSEKREDNNHSDSEKDLVKDNSSKNERDLEVSRIIYTLFEFGVSDRTIENIIKLDVTLKRVEEVLKSAKEKNWGEGAIYKALKEKWILEEKREIISDEELESKRKWLGYFAGLDKGTREEILEIIKPISLERLNLNKKRLARTESIFEFKQELRKLCQ